LCPVRPAIASSRRTMRWNGQGELVCPLRGQSLESRLAAQRSVVQAIVAGAVVAEPTSSQPAFGARFVAEAERLGVPLSSSQRERLSRGSKGQIMCAVEKRLPAINPELLRLLSRKEPEELARELARARDSQTGVAWVVDEVVNTGYTLDIVGDVFSGLDLW